MRNVITIRDLFLTVVFLYIMQFKLKTMHYFRNEATFRMIIDDS